MAAADTKPSARDEAPIPAAAEPVLAGTLALMTSFYHRMPDPDVCRKVVSNLQSLQADPQLSPLLRVVCGKAAQSWMRYLTHALQARAGSAANCGTDTTVRPH